MPMDVSILGHTEEDAEAEVPREHEIVDEGRGYEYGQNFFKHILLRVKQVRSAECGVRNKSIRISSNSNPAILFSVLFQKH
jgi:hypothetical protein